MRESDEKIGDAYEWGLLHHLHTLIRHFYTGCKVTPEAIGSMVVVDLHGGGLPLTFDYADNFPAQSQMITFGDFGIASVFDDSGAAFSCMYDRLSKMDGALSPLQFREVYAELAWLRLHLKDRTRFHTYWDRKVTCTIVAERGSLELLELDHSVRGEMLHSLITGTGVKVHLNDVYVPGDAEKMLRAGKTTLLFDAEGKFLKSSTVSFTEEI